MIHKQLTLFLVGPLLLLLTLVSGIGAESAGASSNFLWKIGSDTTTVYVLGSVHFMKQDVYPLEQRIEDAFDASTVLAVEANISDMANLDIAKLMQSAFYQGDDTLQKHVSRATYELLKKEFAGSGILLDLADKQKPWFLAMTLSSVGLVQLGFDPALGIDMHFLTKAQGRKRIVELESLDYQIDLLSGLTDREQEAFLQSTLRDVKTLSREVTDLVQAWKSGDTQAVESLLAQSGGEDMTSVKEKILYERNRRMVSKIEEYLKDYETYFVVVGAGHLVGDRGIIESLRRNGYAVEQQ